MKKTNSCIYLGFFWIKFFSSLILIQLKQSPEYGARQGSGNSIQLLLLEKSNLLNCACKPVSFTFLNTNKCACSTYYFRKHTFSLKAAARLIHLRLV